MLILVTSWQLVITFQRHNGNLLVYLYIFLLEAYHFPRTSNLIFCFHNSWCIMQKPTRLFYWQIVNRISKQIVEELVFDQTPDAVSRGISGLCSDASAGLFYAYDQNSIFQVSLVIVINCSLMHQVTYFWLNVFNNKM